MTTPAYRIIADQSDVTAHLAKYFISLRLTDKTGMQADELEIELADPTGEINLPKRGVTLHVAIGWQGDLRDKGSFIVDEISESGPPDIITIKARSADFQGTLKVQREESYSGKTIAEILTTIAKRHGLIPAVETGLGGIRIDHIDQTNESDLNFLTRLGEDHDAIATIKAKHLLFIPNGYSKTISGITLAPVAIDRSDGDSHHFTIADRDGSITGVRAKWRDKTGNVARYSTAGDGPNWKTLKRDFPNAVTAYHTAKAEWQKLQRGKKTISLDLALGNPDIIAGRRLTLTGWRSEITGVNWICGDVTHKFGDTGFFTSIEAAERQSN